MGDFFIENKDALPSSFVLNGHYVIEEMIGRGGFGITYSAFDTKLRIKVAIKELYLRKICRRRPDGNVTAPDECAEVFAANRNNFLEEARVMAGLGSAELPGIVKVREFFEDNNTAYIVMELLSGITLREYVKQKGGRLSEQHMCMLLNRVAEALQEMHDRGIIHKDVSPDNIMVDDDGGAKLLDFGGSMRIDEERPLVQLSYRRGYAAPEQYSFSCAPGKTTDVYSLGATVYYCLTGKNPVDAEERGRGRGMLSPRELGADVSSVTERILLKAMDLRQESRYPDAQAFWSQLRESIFTRRDRGQEQSNMQNAAAGKKKAWLLPAAIFIAVALTAGMLLTLLLPGGYEKETQEENVPQDVPDTAETGQEPLQKGFSEYVPEEGMYRIYAFGGEGPCLHVSDDSLQEGALLDVSEGTGTSRLFGLVYTGEGTSLRCAGSGFTVSVLDNSPESGAYVCQRKEDGTPLQYWYFETDEEGNVYICSSFGTYLDAGELLTDPDAKVRLKDFTGEEGQRWKPVRLWEEDQG